MLLALLLSACTPGVDVAPSTLDGLPGELRAAVMTTTDFTTGSLSTLDLATGQAQSDLAPVSGDPLLRVSGGYLVQLDGYLHDTVRVFAPDDLGAPLAEYGLEQGANPYDALVTDEGVWLSQYGRSALELREPLTGEVLATVDLAPYADADGLPEMASLELVDDLLLVALQRLDRDQGWLPEDGRVLAIDRSTFAVVAVWETGSSPRLAASATPGTVWVVSGSYDDLRPRLDGSVRLLDVDDVALGEPVWDEASEGARVDHFAEASDGRVVMALDYDGSYGVRCGPVDATERGPDSADWLSDLALDDRGRALFAARDDTGGGSLWAVRLDDCCDAGRAYTVLPPYRIDVY